MRTDQSCMAAAGLEATTGVTNLLRAFPMEAGSPEDHRLVSPQSPQTPNGTSASDSSFGSITFHVAGRRSHNLVNTSEEGGDSLTQHRSNNILCSCYHILADRLCKLAVQRN